jgi:hypothetical protein
VSSDGCARVIVGCGRGRLAATDLVLIARPSATDSGLRATAAELEGLLRRLGRG